MLPFKLIKTPAFTVNASLWMIKHGCLTSHAILLKQC